MKRPRVLLADDHQIVAEGVRSLLEPHFDLVGIVADGRELVEAAERLQPDVIVTDISMPSLTGIEAAGQLRESGLRAKVIILTMHRDAMYALRALDAGVSGFVLKHSAPAELVLAIREALAGQTFVSPLIAGDLLNCYRDRDRPRRNATAALTARQREVLPLIAAGRSSKEIASLLRISRRTAEYHKARILKVLEIQSTAELIRYAIQHGLVSD